MHYPAPRLNENGCFACVVWRCSYLHQLDLQIDPVQIRLLRGLQVAASSRNVGCTPLHHGPQNTSNDVVALLFGALHTIQEKLELKVQRFVTHIAHSKTV